MPGTLFEGIELVWENSAQIGKLQLQLAVAHGENLDENSDAAGRAMQADADDCWQPEEGIVQLQA